jgi:hypothetical protein
MIKYTQIHSSKLIVHKNVSERTGEGYRRKTMLENTGISK